MTFNVYEIYEDETTKVQVEEDEWVSNILGTEDDALEELLK